MRRVEAAGFEEAYHSGIMILMGRRGTYVGPRGNLQVRCETTFFSSILMPTKREKQLRREVWYDVSSYSLNGVGDRHSNTGAGRDVRWIPGTYKLTKMLQKFPELNPYMGCFATIYSGHQVHEPMSVHDSSLVPCLQGHQSCKIIAANKWKLVL
ncbi:hypothetical protein BGW80DRAFT_5387 [Lactifluus volemus]|nr:hypothetical protein BGW80DRAFT_5387 [Lactifluus volemus]